MTLEEEQSRLLDRLEALGQRFDEHAERTEGNFAEVKEKVTDVETEVKLTNGRVRKLEIWKAEISARLSVIRSGGRGAFVYLIAPIITGVVTALVVLGVS